uniref:Uncharacterized protein n=1 Tax=Picea sitchensis TaxID=3332 RepID=A9NYK2_PICSI|nr:unknown [Picea sitchensis]
MLSKMISFQQICCSCLVQIPMAFAKSRQQIWTVRQI